MIKTPEISPLGDRGILVDFGNNIDDETLKEVLFFKQNLEKVLVKQKVEVTNTYNSLLISYLYTIEDLYGENLTIKELISTANISKNTDYQIYEIPVCYDQDYGLDLKLISEEKKLSIAEVISLHTAPEYQIYFTGFLPGFLYLGGLDEKLYFSRKETPRRSVEKGSVGIGEKQTGIYPKNSPGGWQILGRSPLDFFDKNATVPSPFSAGDKIKFKPVSKAEFLEIREQIKSKNYQIKTLKTDG